MAATNPHYFPVMIVPVLFLRLSTKARAHDDIIVIVAITMMSSCALDQGQQVDAAPVQLTGSETTTDTF